VIFKPNGLKFIAGIDIVYIDRKEIWMKSVNRKVFFDGYRNCWGKLNQSQVDGIEEILTFMEADTALTDLRQCAYVFSTIKHETGDEFKPVGEIGRGKGHAYGIPDPTTGLIYYGRGYVQTTWKFNYLAITLAWNRFHPEDPQDFVKHPEKLLEPKYSYFATSFGMRTGVYTGRYLNQYIKGGNCNYLFARKIINGMDRAELLAGRAVKFEKILVSAAA
jgi:hypothetical protein